MDQQIGNQLGRYEILGQISQDEITSVYKAQDEKLGRTVIIKLLRHSRDYSKDFSQYFIREAQALARLNHPNIAKVLDFGQEQGFLFLVMEYVSEQTLSNLLGQPMNWQEAVQRVIPIAEALDYAHAHHVIHRDLKPANILLTADEHLPMLSDFSVARMVEVEETREMTGTTVGLGSPEYMSPEQGKGVEVDYRADIYALGVILYEMITGKLPFVAESSMEVVIQQVSAPPISPRKHVPDLPEAVEQIIMTALKKDPEERFQAAGEVAAALQQVLQTGSFHRQSRNRIKLPGWVRYAVAGVVVLALGAAALFASGMLPAPYAASPTATVDQAAVVQATETRVDAARIERTATAAPSPQPSVSTATPQAEPTTTLVKPTAVEGVQSELFHFADLPVIPRAGLPVLGAAIVPENAGNLQEVARWGNPRLHSIVWTADNQSLWAASSAGVYLYSASTLELEAFFGGKGWLTFLDVSKDARWVATGDKLGMVRVWDTATGQEKYALAGHSAEITELAFSPDSKRLVSASLDHDLRLWDVEQGKEIAVLKKHAYAVNTLIFSPDGAHIISGAEDFQILTWDSQTGELLDAMQSGGRILDIAMTSDQKNLVVGVNDASVEIWDLQTKKVIKKLIDSKQVTPTYSVTISPNNQLLATGAGDGIVRIWNLSSGQKLWQFFAFTGPEEAVTSDEKVVEVDFSSDGTRVAALSDAGTAVVWNVNSQEYVVIKNIPWVEMRRVVISQDSKTIAFQSGDQEVSVWSLEKSKMIGVRQEIMPKGTIFSPNNRMMLLFRDDQLYLYSYDSAGLSILHTLKGFPVKAAVIFLPDNKMVAAGSSRNVMLWSVASGLELSPERFKYQSNCQVAYAESGEFLAAGSNVGAFLDPEAAGWLCKVNRNPRTLDETFLESVGILAFGLDNQQAELWHNKDGNGINELLKIGSGKVLSAALSPDGQLLATAGEDGLIRLWDMEKKEVIFTMDHHTGPVYDLAFSWDGKIILSASRDGTVEAWALIP